ncbi:MAG: GNAT family N-acetyltransferase [Candidatus Latescibacteria bacterium]|nr:GNAT family N-acetyltransferase [Candidatus Latescibacterota bacterium]
MLPEVIETERLKLRPYRLEDVEDVLSYASDPEWARYLGPVPQPYTRADAEGFLANQLSQDRTKRASWAIEYAGSAVGGVNIGFDLENRVGTIGYSVARRFWGNGLATEAAGAVIETSFAAFPDLNRIQATTDEQNAGSVRVLEKLGMVREGVLRQDQYLRGRFRNTVWCGLLRCEWEARRNWT